MRPPRREPLPVIAPHGRKESGFDIDYAYGRQAELQLGDFLTWIARGNGRVEVKHKRPLDLEFYVETCHDPGRRGVYVPSGISVSTSEAWAFTIGDSGISVLVPTAEIRGMLEDVTTRDRAHPRGSCPTKGRLVSLRCYSCVTSSAWSGRRRRGRWPSSANGRHLVACNTVKLPGGGTAIVCGPRAPTKRCAHCGARSWKLCDGPAAAGPPGATCDRPLCDTCAQHVAPNLDFCRDHRLPASRGVPVAR